ncbi:MAG: polysaccharide pyruvyl transferase family protein [Lachnospiraceae bacterium]|nr:polysaccharide pyruvyl transferase family protein [Lachnospiraceae bacterium]
MEEKNVLLYMHAGSGNHGCEAIVNSTCAMLRGHQTLISYRRQEDATYSLAQTCEILQEKKITKSLWVHAFYLLKKILTRNPMCYIKYRFGEVLQDHKYDLVISVGGDNYCYPEQIQDLILLNQAFREKHMRTVLWGASIEPMLLTRPELVADMNLYEAIFAREQQTYEALRKAGIPEEKLYCYPDPAFTLQARETSLPVGVEGNNCIGINISPMVIGKEQKKGIVLENYRYLIQQLLSHTHMKILLIPHVVWENNDDRKALRELYECFQENDRLILIEDQDCMTLKGIISQMRFMVAARTHASIAAYSTCVPTLVTGYSVKARGIAEELFGTQGHYVLPVQEMQDKEDLWRECQWLMAHEAEIREQLQEVMPGYIAKAREAGDILDKMVKK